MAKRTPMRNCTVCRKRDTRSKAGICFHCKPEPDVSRDGDGIHIFGIGHLTADQALRLAHRIADLLTP